MGKKDKRDIALVIDLEATCWKSEKDIPEGMKSEIIEIGISAIDYRTKEICLRETIIVKPEISKVSEFCTELTTLTQGYVDKHGVSFEEACKILKKKFDSKNRVWMSWGEYDKNQFRRDCENKGVSNPMGRVHFNAKSLFSFTYGINGDLPVGMALEHLGMEFEGTAHRGEDDAYNISRIIRKVFRPLMGEEKYGYAKKMSHQKLEDYLKEKYPENLLDNNATRAINREMPPPPDKSMR